ncbi:DivIVA domain-containing protein [Hymenobacter sp. BRD67]|uniref:DivIVA domain-containing protein n=1 Tax=Hymenobacter sp. BRD67 TaxID=2675877 RepID=UPI0015647FD1|nr:DivIVA domain-containing protein [Hymenobacter sp. BRD67]QKG52275.1 DivIVA domain-containing protein [Hymenobacter sp. BRD67]
MKITALDIRQKTFEKSFRGVDKDEVQAFLTMISQQWERMGDENRELRLKLEHAQQDVQKMREVESSLYRTLKTAEDTGNSITEQAQRDADLRRREAQLLAEQTLAEARQRARAIVEEAYQTATSTVADMQKEVGGLGQECQRLEQQLDALVRDLHHLASDALEKVERARTRPKNGSAAILSRAGSVQVKRPDEAAAPEPSPASDMNVTTASSRPSAVAVASAPAAAPSAAPAARAGQDAPRAAAAPGAYNPKPGQQPDPGRAPAPISSAPKRRPKTLVLRPRRASTSPAPKRCPRRPRPMWSQRAPKSALSAPAAPKFSSPSVLLIPAWRRSLSR